jgi:hypothetical protein
VPFVLNLGIVFLSVRVLRRGSASSFGFSPPAAPRS